MRGAGRQDAGLTGRLEVCRYISCHLAPVSPQKRMEALIEQPTSKPTCPSCGAEVPPDAPRGYCLKCLFALGAAAPDSLPGTLSPSGGEGRGEGAGSPLPSDERGVRGEGLRS